MRRLYVGNGIDLQAQHDAALKAVSDGEPVEFHNHPYEVSCGQVTRVHRPHNCWSTEAPLVATTL